MANSFIPSSELNFDSYKDSLKTFLRQQDRFKDFDFEGSNIGVLLDILAYNTVNNAFYLNMIGSESFLDSATLRASIVSRAKELNYTPRSRVSATCSVDVEIVPNDSPNSIVIPKGYRFRTTNTSGQTMSFLTTQAHVVARNSVGRYIKTGIELREGETVTELFDVVSNTTNEYTSYDSRFILQSENVDVSSIEVEVLQSENDNSPLTYTRAYNVYGLTNTSRIFFVRGYAANQYEVEFGDDTFGVGLRTGNVVRVTYRDTIGADANGKLGFTKTSAIEGYSNITVTVSENAYGGAERESNEEIKFNAPRHYQTQERGVIDSDFRALLIQNFPEVQASYVYGGEKIKKYGSVVVAVKSTASTGRIATSLKKRIKNFLETKTLTTQVYVQDPTYFTLKIDADVEYDLNLITTNTETVESNIVQALETYEQTSLSSFGVKIFTSKLENVIENADPSIIGCEADVSLVYQWVPAQTNVSEAVVIEVNNALKTTSTVLIAVKTSPFYVLDASGNAIQVYLKDNKEGILQLYAVSDDSLFSANVGTVDYSTGAISARLTVQGYDDENIDWVFNLEERHVSIDLSQFALINPSYININMIESV
ncbi:baseplate wedge subunit protein [Rhizobium phage RHph_I1_18]|nr:baseplate wedge subunit protein [Rhizobium phage RHph_I1_18]